MADIALPHSGAWSLRRRMGLCALAGAAAGLGQVPFSLVPVALAGLFLACWLSARSEGARASAWLGWATGTGYFAVTLHWLVEPFLVDIARHGWMAPFALFFSATGFALFWALGFWVARRIGGAGHWLAWAGAMAAVEFARSTILTGFPWALFGYVWSEGPAAQIASWTGSYGLTLLTFLGIATASQIALRGPLAGGLALLAAWLVPMGVGALLMPPVVGPAADAPVIRLVQPNAPQNEKWLPEKAPVFFARQLAYTAAEGAPDLTVWPETAIPYLLEEGHPSLVRIASASEGRPVILGATRVEGTRAYNSVVTVGAGGQITDIYDKHHLVPFGEYMPLGGLTRLIGLQSFAARDGFGFSPGPGPRLLDLGPIGSALPLICYEAIFPRNVAGSPERPAWLLQVTNDAWFGTFSGPYQHLAQARMRSIEQGLPMIRVANTGISAVIDSAGRIGRSLPLGQAGYFDAALPPARPATLYARTGEWPMLLAIALLLGAAFIRRRSGVGD